MSNQYEVLGKAPVAEDLKNLSPKDVHLTIKNLNAGYGKMEILHNFELFVSKAQSLCLIGHNGAGKSTLIKTLVGVYSPDEGDILIRGKKVNAWNALKARESGIETVFQDRALTPQQSIVKNIFMGKELRYPFGFIKEKEQIFEAID